MRAVGPPRGVPGFGVQRCIGARHAGGRERSVPCGHASERPGSSRPTFALPPSPALPCPALLCPASHLRPTPLRPAPQLQAAIDVLGLLLSKRSALAPSDGLQQKALGQEVEQLVAQLDVWVGQLTEEWDQVGGRRGLGGAVGPHRSCPRLIPPSFLHRALACRSCSSCRPARARRAPRTCCAR